MLVDINLLGNFISSHLQNKCIHKILPIVDCFTPEIVLNPADVLLSCQRQLINFQLHLTFNRRVLPIGKKVMFRGSARGKQLLLCVITCSLCQDIKLKTSTVLGYVFIYRTSSESMSLSLIIQPN